MKRAGAGILPQRMVSSKQHPLDFLSVCACRGGLMSLHRKRIACSAAPRLKGPSRSYCGSWWHSASTVRASGRAGRFSDLNLDVQVKKSVASALESSEKTNR